MRNLICFTLLATCASGARADIFAVHQKLGRGINLGNALEAPREGAWGVTLKPEYFEEIKAAGFATVRLPVRWSAHARKSGPFAIDEEFLRRVDWAVEQALANRNSADTVRVECVQEDDQ